MADQLFEPIAISYRGLLADNHFVDAQQFGRSIIGASKIANGICHDLFFDKITHDPRSYHVRFCVNPSKANGLLQELVAIVVTGLPLFSPIAIAVGREFIEKMIAAMISKVLNRPADTSDAFEIVKRLAEHNAELTRSMTETHKHQDAWFRHTIDRLTQEHRAPLRELPAPVGQSVRIMQIGSDKASPTIIDEPIAEVLRSREPIQLGDEIEYDVLIEGVFKTNGACKVKILGENQIVSGKIVDPSLDKPNNVYTKALHEAQALHVIAKPTLRDGKIHKLFITHAEPKSPPTSSTTRARA
jgi:hypothetical protein